MAFIHSPKIVTDGLVLYLDAANSKSYVSGSTVWNSMVSASFFTVNNPSLSTSSFEINPPAIYITQPSGIGGTNSDAITGSFSFSENLSIELWYKTLTTGSGISNLIESPGILQLGSYNTNASLTLWDWSVNTPGVHNIRTFINNGATWSHQVLSTTNYTDNQWVGRYHHIVLNFSGSAGKWNRYNLYIDGILQTTVNFTTPFPSASIAGGNKLYAPAANGGSARNSYAILKIYNRELTMQEMAQNYNATKGRFGL